ncbi:hypothetical protein ACVGWX_08290, partial [Enterobacter hormaechei]
LLAGNKVDDLTFGGQRRLAAPEVGNQPVDGQISNLRILLQHLKENRRQQAGYVRPHPALYQKNKKQNNTKKIKY